MPPHSPSESPLDPPPQAGGALVRYPGDEGAACSRENEEGPGRPLCPRCRVSLLATMQDTGIAWCCLKCRGQSLNFSQFRRRVPESYANLVWQTAKQMQVAPGIRAACPECRKAMNALLVPWQELELEMDICLKCQRLWLEDPQNQLRRICAVGEYATQKPPVVTITPRVALDIAREQARRRDPLLARPGRGKRPEDAEGFGFATATGERPSSLLGYLAALLIRWLR